MPWPSSGCKVLQMSHMQRDCRTRDHGCLPNVLDCGLLCNARPDVQPKHLGGLRLGRAHRLRVTVHEGFTGIQQRLRLVHAEKVTGILPEMVQRASRVAHLGLKRASSKRIHGTRQDIQIDNKTGAS